MTRQAGDTGGEVDKRREEILRFAEKDGRGEE